MLKRFFVRYRNVFTRCLIAAGVLAAVIGAGLVHWPRFSGQPLRFLSVTAYDVIKLHTFSSLLGVDEPKPLLYDIAIWLAPLSTMTAAFSAVCALSGRARLLFRSLFGGGMLIFGLNEQTIAFVHAQRAAGHRGKMLCIGAAGAKDALAEALGREGVLCLLADMETLPNRKRLSARRLRAYDRIVLLEEEPRAYALLNFLDQQAERFGLNSLAVFAAYQNPQLHEHMQRGCRWPRLRVRRFSRLALAVEDLLTQEDFHFSPEKIPTEKNANKSDSAKAIADAIGTAHLLLVGFGALGAEFLQEYANVGVFNPFTLNSVSVLAADAKEQMEAFVLSHPAAEQVFDIQVCDAAPSSAEAQRFVEEQQSQRPFTHVIVIEENAEAGMALLLRNQQAFAGCVVGFYAPRPEDAQLCKDAFANCFRVFCPFGENLAVYHPDRVFKDEMMVLARAFHRSYEQAGRAYISLGAKKTEQETTDGWSALSEHLQRSNLALALHHKTKIELLHRLSAQEFGTTKALLSRCAQTMQGESLHEKAEAILNDPVTEYLAAAEHRRWCNFHLMQNWRFGARDDTQKTHPCLITDWQTFIQDEQRRATVCYDLLPYLIGDDKVVK
ncbi:MAG: hypothetical protein ACOX58_02720 [Christensenellales bacterium]